MTADPTYGPAVYHRQKDQALVVASGGLIVVQAGGKIVPDSETQAAHIAAISTTSGVLSAAERAKFNSLITGCQNVGIFATS